MNVPAFISPTLPLSYRRHHRISISRHTKVLVRQQPRATANKPNNPLDHFSTHLLYTVTPLLLTNPLSAFAQTTQTSQSTDSAPPIDPAQITQSDLDSSLTSRILGWTAFILLLISSIGAVFLSLNSFILSREDKKHREWVQNRIDGKPYPKDFWSPDVDTNFPPRAGGGAIGGEKGMNREMRRMEKRMKDKDEKEKKRKDKLAEQRGAANPDKEKRAK